MCSTVCLLKPILVKQGVARCMTRPPLLQLQPSVVQRGLPQTNSVLCSVPRKNLVLLSVVLEQLVWPRVARLAMCKSCCALWFVLWCLARADDPSSLPVLSVQLKAPKVQLAQDRRPRKSAS